MTYREIAAKLNVSPATISHVINNKPGVSEATRAHIRQKLEELGLSYLLKTDEESPVKETRRIWFLVYKRTGAILDIHPYFLSLAQILEQNAARYGYSMVIRILDGTTPPPDFLPGEKEADGIILYATEMTDRDFAPFRNAPCPLVALDNALGHTDCSAVSINNEMGTWQAIEHLVNTGHRRIGYIQAAVPISSFTERAEGFRRAARVLGLPIREEDIIQVNYSEAESFRGVMQYLQDLEPEAPLPDAFVFDDDILAFGALQAFAQHGIRVPEDVSLIGFNNHANCEITAPPLTSVDVHADAFLPGCVDLLMDLIRQYREGGSKKKEPVRRKLRFSTEIIKRQSVQKR